MRRSYKRSFNKVVRKVNKALADDDLWRGRFMVHQLLTYWKKYDDNSGGQYCVLLEFIDKKTGTTNLEWEDSCLNRYGSIMWLMNDFIVGVCDVWRNEKPYENIKDWRHITYEDIVRARQKKVWPLSGRPVGNTGAAKR